MNPNICPCPKLPSFVGFIYQHHGELIWDPLVHYLAGWCQLTWGRLVVRWFPGLWTRLKMLFKKPGNWHFQQLGTPKSQCLSRFPVISLYPDAPWCWNSYLHILQNWAIFGLNVGVHIPAPWFAYGIVPMILQYFRVCFRRVSHWSSWGSHPKTLIAAGGPERHHRLPHVALWTCNQVRIPRGALWIW